MTIVITAETDEEAAALRSDGEARNDGWGLPEVYYHFGFVIHGPSGNFIGGGGKHQQLPGEE